MTEHDFQSMTNDELMELSDKLYSKFYRLFDKKKLKGLMEDLNDLLEAERELTIREGGN